MLDRRHFLRTAPAAAIAAGAGVAAPADPVQAAFDALVEAIDAESGPEGWIFSVFRDPGKKPKPQLAFREEDRLAYREFN